MVIPCLCKPANYGRYYCLSLIPRCLLSPGFYGTSSVISLNLIQIEQTKRSERRRELFSRANCGTIPFLYWMIDDSSSSSDGRGGTSKPPPFSTSSCATAKKLSVHEPPRWRFINRAKKTEGYSSMAAGYIVKGACIYASRPRFFRRVCWISSLYAESRV